MKRIARLPTFLALALAVLTALNALAQDVRPFLPGTPRAASPEDVARIMAKPPAGLEIVDVRPPAEYADYALPGSLNLDSATVLADESLLSGAGPLLLVDKDGALAFALAGALAPRASRPVMAMTGGLEAWWNGQELGQTLGPAGAGMPGTDSGKVSQPGGPPGGAADGQGAPASPARNTGS
jgi:rhodanese-related sulfurtransferase